MRHSLSGSLAWDQGPRELWAGAGQGGESQDQWKQPSLGSGTQGLRVRIEAQQPYRGQEPREPDAWKGTKIQGHSEARLGPRRKSCQGQGLSSLGGFFGASSPSGQISSDISEAWSWLQGRKETTNSP